MTMKRRATRRCGKVGLACRLRLDGQRHARQAIQTAQEQAAIFNETGDKSKAWKGFWQKRVCHFCCFAHRNIPFFGVLVNFI